MKKILVIFTCLILLSLTSSIALSASTAVEAFLFPAKIKVNGVEKPLDNSYALLNYQGHAYVPVRYLSETLGQLVDYDDETQTISIFSNEEISKYLRRIRNNIRIGMSKEALKVNLDSPAQSNQNDDIWRYDLKKTDGYTYDGFTPDALDLMNGQIDIQVFIYWEKDKLSRYEVWYSIGEIGKKEIHKYTSDDN